MAAVMQRAIAIDEEKANKENEILSRLITENKVSVMQIGRINFCYLF
jgi:hypothetical protein